MYNNFNSSIKMQTEYWCKLFYFVLSAVGKRVLHLSMLTPRGGVGGWAYVGYLIINCIPTLGILISILALSWGNLNRITFINIVFIAIYCKMVGHLTKIDCPTVGHLIENLLKKSNAPPMPDPPSGA
jgi:hypothetical protein